MRGPPMPAPWSAGQRDRSPCRSRLARRSPEVSPATMPRRKVSSGDGPGVAEALVIGSIDFLSDDAARGRCEEVENQRHVGARRRIPRAQGVDLNLRLLEGQALAVNGAMHLLDGGDALGAEVP